MTPNASCVTCGKPFADTKATHTPGPLRKVRSMREGRAALVDAENRLLCVAVAADPEGERLARLALCWNTHDELVAALNRALSIRNVTTGKSMPVCWTREETRRSWEAWEIEARAVLAKVEGGES